MSRPRTLVAAAVLWCVVVAAVASLVWVVIDRAGQGVVPMSQTQAPDVGATSGARHPRSPTSSQSPDVPSTAAGPESAPAHSRSSQTPRPSVRVSSWSGTAGHLGAECRGQVASLVSAYPNPGWNYAIESRGPGMVTVRYTRAGEDRSVTVSARCANGTPRLAVTSPTAGDD